MTDREIVQGLIARDERVTEEFFWGTCKPLFCKIIAQVFCHEVEYDEFVNELYVYLMEDNARKLKDFGYRSSVYTWLKVLAIRYFIRKRDRMIDDSLERPLYNMPNQAPEEYDRTAVIDLEHLFEQMSNERYVFVIRKLLIDDCEPEQLANEMGVTTANLYNIKRRAMAQLTSIALNDINEYEK